MLPTPLPFLDVAAFPPRSLGWCCCSLLSFWVASLSPPGRVWASLTSFCGGTASLLLLLLCLRPSKVDNVNVYYVCDRMRRSTTTQTEEERRQHDPQKVGRGGRVRGYYSATQKERGSTTGESITTRKGRGRKAPPPKGRGNTTTAHEE